MWQDNGLNGDAQRIEQLGWMLFFKIFSDKDQDLELVDDNYKSPIPAELHWGNWAGDDEGMTGEDLVNFVDRELFPKLRNIYVGDNKRAKILREVFEGNNNYMKSGINIRKVLNKLNELDFNVAKDRHAFGELYETILKDLQSAGKSGEFYTPRAITQFLTEMVDPHIGERVLDLAAGTGGFLTAVIEHLRKGNTSIETLKLIQDNVMGWEYKPLPFLLATTNLILHDVEVPQITFRDALDQPLTNYTEKDRVDVILANPPFGGIVANNNENNFPQNFRTKESADLFLVLMIHLLKMGGRAGIVLPDGSLSGEGVKQRIREKLLTECNLHTIIRLPNSVFQPYAIVPTNLLFFEKGKPTREIWYYEHRLPEGQKAYGKTKPIRLEEFQPIKDWWSNREENAFCWKVHIETIKERGFDLDIKNPHKKEIVFEHTPSEFIQKLESEFSRTNALINQIKQEISGGRTGLISLFERLGLGEEKLEGFSVEVTNLKDFVPELRKAFLSEAMRGKLVSQNETDEPAQILLGKIKAEKEDLIAEKRLNKEKPLPEIKPGEITFDVPTNWTWCRLGELITMIYGSGLTKAETIPNAKFPVFGSNGIVGYYNKFLTDKRAIIIGRKGSSGALNISNMPSWTTDVAYYVEETKNLDFAFLYYLLKNLNLDKLGKGIKPGLNRSEAYNLPVALPPFSEQQRIVEKLNRLMNLCDELELCIFESKKQAGSLLQVSLKEALEN